MLRSPLLIIIVAVAACHGGRRSPSSAQASGCEAEVVRGGAAGDRYPSWLAAWRALRADSSSELEAPPPPTTDEDARAQLCGDGGCAGAGPWLVEHHWDDTIVDQTDLVFAVGGALVVHRSIGTGMAGRCAYADAVELTDGPVVRVTTASEEQTDVEVDVSGDEVRPCGAEGPAAQADDEGGDEEGEGDDELDEPRCETACFTDDVRTVDRFYDPATGAQLLSVTRVAHPPVAGPDHVWLSDEYTFREQLAVTAPGQARVTGPGCDLALDAGR